MRADTVTHLTRAQTRALAALERLTEDGWPVSVRELQAELGCATSTAWDYLIELERVGLVERHPRNPKGGYRIVSAP